MKKLLLLLIPGFLYAQEEPTDSVTIKALEDFNIYDLATVAEAVSNFEELEEALNDSSSHINNVDINGDGEVDYLKITEHQDGNAHTALISAIVGENELQTIVSIEMERISSTEASLQLVGEESFYGEEIILEPEGGKVDISEEGAQEKQELPYEDNLRGPAAPIYYYAPPAVHVTIVYGVYRPAYVLWVSPVAWGVYPAWYRPWPRYRRSYWRRRHYHHHRHHYHRTTARRSHAARNMHKSHRHTSPKTRSNNNVSNPKAKSSSPKTSPSKGHQNKSKSGGRRR